MNAEALIEFMQKYIVSGDEYTYVEMLEAHDYLANEVENLSDSLNSRIRFIADIKERVYPNLGERPYDGLSCHDKILSIVHSNSSGLVVVLSDGGPNFTFPIKLLDMSEAEISDYYLQLKAKNSQEADERRRAKQDSDAAAQQARDRAEYDRLKKIFES